MLSRPPFGPIAFWRISWYAILIVIGVVLAIWLCTREEKRLGLPKDTALDFALVVLPLGIIGARLYFVLFNLDLYLDEPLHIFSIREGGLAIFGGIIFGLLGAWLVARHKKIKLSSLLDMVAPGLVLAQGIGRWGNYFNMEAYGARLGDDFASLQFFPFAVEIGIGDHWYWQMATFFYEFVVCMVVFLLLWAYRKRSKHSGDVFYWYLLLYCAGRTVIEGLRDDSLTIINASVRISQILAALACLAVVVYFAWRYLWKSRGKLPFGLACGVGALCLATCFLGEFERGAYGNLFWISQSFMVITGLASLAYTWYLLRWEKSAMIPWLIPSAVLTAIWFITFFSGLGRVYYDNTLYVSLRQILSMLQLVFTGILIYWGPKKEAPIVEIEVEAQHA